MSELGVEEDLGVKAVKQKKGQQGRHHGNKLEKEGPRGIGEKTSLP